MLSVLRMSGLTVKRLNRVSAVGPFAVPKQDKLVHAAKAAGAQLFVPAEVTSHLYLSCNGELTNGLWR